MSAADRLPVLFANAKATQQAAEDLQVAQHNRRVAADYAAFKKAQRVKS